MMVGKMMKKEYIMRLIERLLSREVLLMEFFLIYIMTKIEKKKSDQYLNNSFISSRKMSFEAKILLAKAWIIYIRKTDNNKNRSFLLEKMRLYIIATIRKSDLIIVPIGIIKMFSLSSSAVRRSRIGMDIIKIEINICL